MSPEGAERRSSLLAAVGLAGALAFAGLLAWQIAGVLLILFGAVLLAILLDGLARLIQRVLPVGRRLCLMLGILVILGLLSAVVIFAGPKISDQVAHLAQLLPDAVEETERKLEQYPFTRALLHWSPEPARLFSGSGRMLGRISSVFSSAFGVVTQTLIIVIVGIYLALSPDLYVRGLLTLAPPRHRARAREVLRALDQALSWWIIGRLASMALVGGLTGVGLWIIGMPLPLALGTVAGILSFVPVVGPLVAAVPGLLIALMQGEMMLVYAIVVYWTAQILEGNVITPVIQKRTVALAPGVLIMAQLLVGVLFGFAGVILATPLVVVVMVLIQMLYVRSYLGTEVHVLGDHDSDQEGDETWPEEEREEKASPDRSARSRDGRPPVQSGRGPHPDTDPRR